MEWLDSTGTRQVTAACISREDWAAIVKEQPAYALEAVRLLDATLYEVVKHEQGQPIDPDYLARLAAAQAYATGISWYEAAVWCNALGASLGLAPAYQLNGEPARWAPAVSRVRGKLTLTEIEAVPGAKGVRLLTTNERKAASKVAGFTAIQGLYEWGMARRRAPFIFESLVFEGATDNLCNGIFHLPWNAFRVVRG